MADHTTSRAYQERCGKIALLTPGNSRRAKSGAKCVIFHKNGRAFGIFRSESGRLKAHNRRQCRNPKTHLFKKCPR